MKSAAVALLVSSWQGGRLGQSFPMQAVANGLQTHKHRPQKHSVLEAPSKASLA